MSDAKRFFISHAGPDKPIAIALKAQLDQDAWVDLFEIELGDILIEQISRGIEAASDFVLLWSEHSAASRWVKFELHMAFIRYLEDNAIAMKVVALDKTPVPLHLRVFLQKRGTSSVSEIAESLVHGTVAPATQRQFYNRNEQIDLIESALYDSALAAVWVVGMGGAGKKALAAEAVRRVTVGTAASRRVAVNAALAEPELELATAAALSVPPLQDTASLPELAESVKSRLATFMQSGGVWIFEEAESWLEDDGTFGRVADLVMQALVLSPNLSGNLAIFTSRRAPVLGSTWERAATVIRLAGLDSRYALPMLRSRGAQGTDEDLTVVASELGGHPLALEIVAPQTPITPQLLAQHRLQVATDLIPTASLAPTTWALLEALAAIDGPFALEDLAEFLSIDSDALQGAISQAVEFSLVNYSQLGFLELHPLIHDYYLRSFRKKPTSKEETEELAELARAQLQAFEPGSAEFVSSLVTTFKLLGMAGRFDEARSLRSGMIGTLLSTATELFHAKRYAEVLLYVDEALTGNIEFDRDALSLKSKSLAHLGRFDEARTLGDQLVSVFGDSPRIVRDRGRVEMIARNWDDAIRFFEDALGLRKRPNPNVLTDIAQAEYRRGRVNEAGAAARQAIQLGGETPYTLALYAQVLEAQGHLAEAEKIITTAVQREPRNSNYRHRLGRIAQARGDRSAALIQFKSAVELDPAMPESWLSIANLLMDEGDHAGAEEALLSAEKLPGLSAGVHFNLKARLALLIGDLATARTLVEKALAERRDSQNLALAIKVAVHQAQSGLLDRAETRSYVRRLAKEMEAGGKLQEILDFANAHPEFF